MAKTLTYNIVLQWVTLAQGRFTSKQIWDELGITTPENKASLRVYLSRMANAGIIAKTSVDGTFRRADTEKIEIDWQAADIENVVPILFPFDLHDYAKIYPKSIIVVAASKNEGKTTFILEMLKLNAGNLPCDLYNSETGPEQLKQRLSPLHFPTPPPFKTYQHYDNFADVIEPDRWSFIDYLDFNSEVYLVGAEIDAIFRKLTTGGAVIALQKPPPSMTYIKGVKHVIDRDLAYGGGFSAKRAVLYLSMSSHKLKIVYCKTPLNPRIKPNNMQWTYDFDEAGLFCNQMRYYGDEIQNSF